MVAGLDDGWADAVDGALTTLVDRAGVDVAFGARVVPGGDRMVIHRLRGTRTAALQDLVIRNGTGLGGKAMLLKRPVTVTDYVRAREISHHYDGPVSREGLHSIMAVPVVTAGQVTGVLYAGLRQRLELGERMQRLAMGLAGEVRRRLAAPPRPPAPLESAPADMRLRDACRELGAIIERVADPAVRADLEALRRRMTGDPLPRRTAVPRAVLSRRELEALAHAAAGLPNAEIAARMGLSPGTVKAYLRSVMRKLGARNRIEAVNAARALGYSL
ncbi:LuxR C-terminal-related transcriptional regulator [Thermomonospora cellulosilytica]|uniref:DNA-binding CsgD family transcriptional regulator n=1 Tax=Thermomonospora cellulosilytica TaxID=1411118 RepID=A0A7W3MX19_9ACTN|nr:LuxR C-terminal-related transcriptional regulator [Thermomonospora cellulosilytica]MBA9003446.1 DNA-binding CsgD family transcriptional regulator [Thermomonospora cellulosilytica]